MSIRRRNDSVKPGAGIDGSQGERFTKTGLTGPDDMCYQESDHKERSYSRNTKKGQDQWTEVGNVEMPMQNVRDFQWRSETRDIWSDAVEGNGEVNQGFSGPVKYGVNRSQGSKR
jgi:hypothetical protein